MGTIYKNGIKYGGGGSGDNIPVYTTEEYEQFKDTIPEGTKFIISDDYQNTKNILSEGLSKKSVKIIGHRGYSSKAPENTRWSAMLAGYAGFWGTECDICKTKDGYFVLMHDATVDRTTDGTGNVSDLTLEQIRSLKVDMGGKTYERLDEGTGFERMLLTGHNNKFLIRQVPTLEEYLDACIQTGITPVIEFKTSLSVSDVPEVLSIINTYNMVYKCVYISFDTNICEAIKSYDQAITAIQPLLDLTESNIDYCMMNGFAGIDVPYEQCTKELIDYAHKNGVEVNCWTCDDVFSCEDLVLMGVDYITTNTQLITSDVTSRIGNIEHLGFGNNVRHTTVADCLKNIQNNIYNNKPKVYKPENGIIARLNGYDYLEVLPFEEPSYSKRIMWANRCYTYGATLLKVTFTIGDKYRFTLRPFDSNGKQLEDLGWFYESGLITLPGDTAYFLFYASTHKDKKDDDTVPPTQADIKAIENNLIITPIDYDSHNFVVKRLENLISAKDGGATVPLAFNQKFNLQTLSDRALSVINVRGYSRFTAITPIGVKVCFYSITGESVTKDYGWCVTNGQIDTSKLPGSLADGTTGLGVYFAPSSGSVLTSNDLANIAANTAIILYK